MFSEKEFDQALKAYQSEKDGRTSNSFTNLRKKNSFFEDVSSKEDLNRQVESFINLISDMDREALSNRYVILSFILDFCKYLERDFLFNIKNKRDFVDMKEKVGGFIDKILEANKNFSQNAKLHTIEHLLEYYGILLDGLEEAPLATEESSGLWSGNALW
jgi:ATP-dependent exoDNAse (exonuclease V) beta subunit